MLEMNPQAVIRQNHLGPKYQTEARRIKGEIIERLSKQLDEWIAQERHIGVKMFQRPDFSHVFLLETSPGPSPKNGIYMVSNDQTFFIESAKAV